MLLGSDARQAYSADTFCLGLSLLHLATGSAAYEVHLQHVLCPQYLILQLQKLWLTKQKDNSYYVINEVIASLIDDSNDVGSSPRMVLYHTLYRYLVLFGASREFLVTSNELYRDSPVWEVLIESLKLDVGSGVVKKTQKRISPRHVGLLKDAQNQYERDKGMWSVNVGNHPVMTRYSILSVTIPLIANIWSCVKYSIRDVVTFLL